MKRFITLLLISALLLPAFASRYEYEETVANIAQTVLDFKNIETFSFASGFSTADIDFSELLIEDIKNEMINRNIEVLPSSERDKADIFIRATIQPHDKDTYKVTVNAYQPPEMYTVKHTWYFYVKKDRMLKELSNSKEILKSTSKKYVTFFLTYTQQNWDYLDVSETTQHEGFYGAGYGFQIGIPITKKIHLQYGASLITNENGSFKYQSFDTPLLLRYQFFNKPICLGLYGGAYVSSIISPLMHYVQNDIMIATINHNAIPGVTLGVDAKLWLGPTTLVASGQFVYDLKAVTITTQDSPGKNINAFDRRGLLVNVGLQFGGN